MARFKIEGKIIRYQLNPGKRLALVVIKDAINQRHLPLWVPILGEPSIVEFIRAKDHNTPLIVEGWLNLQPDGRFMLRADRLIVQKDTSLS
jgi:hypothetical protein